MSRKLFLGFRSAETQCSSLARSESVSQTQMEVVESNTMAIHTSQSQPFRNGFPRSTVLPPQAGNAAAVGTFEDNNNSHLKIPFRAENGELKLKSEKEI